MRKRLLYKPINISPIVRYYASPGIASGARSKLQTEEYAKARETIPVWCLDGLVCAKDAKDRPVVVLVVRRDKDPSDGPFRNEAWVVGGRWDMVTPWEQFIREKAAKELFGGRRPKMEVKGPIGAQLFATGWGRNTDGPFGRQGVTLQFCYQLILKGRLSPNQLRPDGRHSGIRIFGRGDSLSGLHPYIRDVVQMSGWLA